MTYVIITAIFTLAASFFGLSSVLRTRTKRKDLVLGLLFLALFTTTVMNGCYQKKQDQLKGESDKKASDKIDSLNNIIKDVRQTLKSEVQNNQVFLNRLDEKYKIKRDSTNNQPYIKNVTITTRDVDKMYVY